MRELLLLVVVLACPLMMVLMMRGHGHARDTHTHDQGERWSESASTAELRRQRDALDQLIDARETATPAGGGGFERDGDRTPSG